MDTQNPHDPEQELPVTLTIDDAISAIESILFVAGKSLAIADLQKLLQVSENFLQDALLQLAKRAEEQRRGVRLQRSGDQIQFVSAPENSRFVAVFLGMPTHAKLTTAALETLAIIAYRQPITRSQLEQIRGVNCDRALATLVQYGLVMEIGRAATIGRPVLFGTTTEFLQQFGLASLDALPAPDHVDELEKRRTNAANTVRQTVLKSDDEQTTAPSENSTID